MTTVTLESYTHLLGSYNCLRPYAFSDVNTLSPLPTTTCVFESEDRWLTLIAPLTVRLADTGEDARLPAGTKLRVVSDRPEGDLPVWYLNGEPETLCFSGLPYAG